MSEEQVDQAQEIESAARPEISLQEMEKMEEAKFKAKYPAAVPGGPSQVRGHSAFLQKRLAKGQKFFDSGDYQMAKQKMGGVNKLPLKVPGPMFPTGEAIPTPETVPARKTSLVQPSKLASVTIATTPTSSLGSNIS